MRLVIFLILFLFSFSAEAQRTSFFFTTATNQELADEPKQQAHSISVDLREPTSETISWENPIDPPDAYIILAKQGAAVDDYPVDGIGYSANSVFGSGDEIGTDNFVVGLVDSDDPLTLTVTGLTSEGIVYHYRVMAYNGSGATANYRILDEKGHLWATDSSPPTGMIGTDINEAKTLEVSTGGTFIYYRARSSVDDPWGAWTLWASITGAELHSCRILEGGTIHNASGTPVSMKVMFNDHSGSAKVYAGYTPGDTPETVFTGSGSQKWNEGAWNASRSEYMVVSDDGTSRVATLTNARTVSYSIALDGNSIASVCATSSSTIPFIAAFKNAGSPGQAIAALISGTWTLRSTPTGKVFHMIKPTPGLGGSPTRIFCSSADGTGNDAIWSDDYFATYTSSAITGEFGSFAFDLENIRIAVFSRTAGGDIAISIDAIQFELIDNPVANAVLFNGVADGNGFNAQASSGSFLRIKTIPSNITNAATRYADYENYLAALDALGASHPSDNFIRDFAYYCRDNDLWDNLEFAYFAKSQTSKAAVRVNLKDPSQLLTEVGTVTFANESVKSASSSYYRTGQVPSVIMDLNNAAYICEIQTNVDGTQWSYGVTGTGGSTQRVFFNPRTGNSISSANHSGTSTPAGSQTSSVGAYLNLRTGSTTAGHDIYKNGTEWSGSGAASTSLPNLEIYWLAHNNNGTAGFFDTRENLYFVGFSNGITILESVGAHNFLRNN